jgi:hypothetical protein
MTGIASPHLRVCQPLSRLIEGDVWGGTVKGRPSIKTGFAQGVPHVATIHAAPAHAPRRMTIASAPDAALFCWSGRDGIAALAKVLCQPEERRPCGKYGKAGLPILNSQSPEEVMAPPRPTPAAFPCHCGRRASPYNRGPARPLLSAAHIRRVSIVALAPVNTNDDAATVCNVVTSEIGLPWFNARRMAGRCRHRYEVRATSPHPTGGKHAYSISVMMACVPALVRNVSFRSVARPFRLMQGNVPGATGCNAVHASLGATPAEQQPMLRGEGEDRDMARDVRR